MNHAHCGLSHCGFPDHGCSCLCGPCVQVRDDEEAAEFERDCLARENKEDEQAKYDV